MRKGACRVELQINGRTVSYIDEGQGPVLLFLHGWAAPVKTYRVMTAHLAQYCRVVAPDLPGFGGSEEPPVPWTVDDYVDFTEAFCKELGITEAVLAGHSFGGRIIIKLLNRTPCALNVRKIVLMDAAGIKPKRKPMYYIKVGAFKAAKWVCSLPGIRHLFPQAVSNARRLFGSADYSAASDVMRRTLTLSVNEDLSHLLPTITASSLLIWGDKDTATPLSDGQKMEKLIPDAGLVVLKDAGHFAFAQRWGQCRLVLDSFLKEG